MPNLAKIEAIAAKLDPSPEAEPAPEPTAAPPAGGNSEAGSAPADAGAPAPEGSSPGATIDPTALERKLAEDRARREEKARRRKLAEDEAAIAKAREEAEAEKKRDAEEREKWKKMSYRERALAEGKNPLEVFKEMQEEALRAGTPDAKIEALQKLFTDEMESLRGELKSEKEARAAEKQEREEERKREREALSERQFQHDFERTIAKPEYESLRDEYPDEQLFGFVASSKQDLKRTYDHGKALGVVFDFEKRLSDDEDLTDEPITITMSDILNVMKANQDRHFARLEEQRRKKTAASQAGTGAPEKKPPVASRPTVNGTAERNAGSLGNQLAATTAAESRPEKLSREEKVRRLGEKYG